MQNRSSRTRPGPWLPAFLILPFAFCILHSAAPPRPGGAALTPADRKLLDKLLKDFLFDPAGAQRVRLTCEMRTAWGTTEKATRHGWLVKGTAGRPDRVFFADGESAVAPAAAALTRVDFVASCRDVLKGRGGKGAGDVWDRMHRTSLGLGDADDLAVAAWLRRLGRDDLAAGFLARARRIEGDPVARLRADLAWRAYAGMVHAFMARADEEAVAHGRRLLRLYPEALKQRAFSQAKAVVADLRRRRQAGRFGKAPGPLPPGFDAWPGPKKVALLIERLDEVDARQGGQPGGVDLGSDPTVQALIKIGDPAVTALIDAVEKDERLTRSVHFWRDFARSRTVLGVREAALTAVMSILRVRVFEPASTGDSFTARGEEGAARTARRLREYWKKYGGMPFEARMMSVLRDPRAVPEALREAAVNLATLDAEGTIGTTVWVGGFARPRRGGPNPAVARFTAPSAAEAILAAMDRDLAAYDRKKEDSLHDYRRRGIEDTYVFALVELGDRRIAAELARRSRSAATVRMRRKWAYAALWLGEKGPWQAYAVDFAAGKVRLPADDQENTRDEDQPGTVELRGAVGYLIATGTPESDRALAALAGPKHPGHAIVRKYLLRGPDSWDARAWFTHPFALAVLRLALDDTSPTGATYKVEGGRLTRAEKDGSSSGGVPGWLRDPKVRRESARERVCDQAALVLGELVVGLPGYHPLLKDADRRLGAMKATLDRFKGRYRRPPEAVAEALGMHSLRPMFVPQIKPLGRAATEEDVKAGRAVFHLAGKGRPAGLRLPAVATLKPQAAGGKDGAGLLVVQAEVGPGGTVYGAVGRDGFRVVPDKEVARVRPLPPPEK